MAGRSLGRGKIERHVSSDGRTVYRADFVDARGVRHRRNLASDRGTAERILAKLIRDRDLEAGGLGGETGLDLAVADLAVRYLGELRSRSRARDVLETERRLARVLAAMALILVRDVTKARVVAWRQTRTKAGASNKTINNEVVTLVACLNFAVSLGQLPVSPLQGLKPLPIGAKHQRRRPRALSEQEIAALLRAASGYDASHPYLLPREPLLRFLVGTGARWSETIALTWADYDRELGLVTFRGENTKTGVLRSIPLDPSLLVTLEDLRARAMSETGGEICAKIFVQPKGGEWTRDGHNLRRWLVGILKAAGIPRAGVSIHSLRHTFATRLARAGVSVAAAMRLLGHRSPQMTLAVYSHVTTEDAREAIRALPPLPDSGTDRKTGEVGLASPSAHG